MRAVSKWSWGLVVMGLLGGCGTKPATPLGETVDEETAEPAPEQAPVPEQTPVAESPPPPAEPTPGPVDDTAEVSRPGLCGPASRPCSLLLQETFTLPFPGGAGAELVFDEQQRPHLLASGGGQYFRGTLAVRSGPGQWEFQQLPTGWSGASLTRSPEGRPLLTHIEGGPHLEAPLTFWEQVSGSWQLEATLGVNLNPWLTGRWLRRDATGRLHAFLATSGAYPRFVYAWGSGEWRTQPLGSGGWFLHYPGFNLSPRGEGLFAYWEVVDGRWTLTWQAASSSPERIFALDCCGENPQWPQGKTAWAGLHPALTQGGRPGDPELRHLFFIRTASQDASLGELAYAVREAQGPWRISTLFQDELLKDCFSSPPTAPGDRCEEERIVQRPVALLTTGQELRLLLSWTHTRIQASANCRRQYCQWESVDYVHDYRLKLAWLEAGQPQTVTLWQTPELPRAMAAEADAQGRIHVVTDMGDDQWRYLLVDSP